MTERVPDASSSPAASPFLAGGGELGDLIRAKDWTTTPLGPPDTWPQSLKTSLRIMLTSRQPIWIGWGRELTYFYNDPYRAIIGGKHPHALGKPTLTVWREIAGFMAPLLERAMLRNEGSYFESQLLIMERNGYPEETYYTFSFSPIPNDDGAAGGIICANTDDTARVIGERQLALLRELGARTANARTWIDACSASGQALASDARDMPFALIYISQPGETTFSLAAAAGVDPAHPLTRVSPEQWPLAQVLANREIFETDASAAGTVALPTGAWDIPPSRLALVPLPPIGPTGRRGVLVVGLNPFRLLDDGYRNFLVLIGGQIAASLASAQAFEEERRRAEALTELDRAKTEFFSNVSHEFRTPLTLMLGPVEDLLGAGADLAPAARTQLETVHRNSLRLLKLVNTMLDFSRIEAGRAEASYVPLDLAAVTAELASVFRSAIERAGLRFTVECPPLPEPVYVDRDLWEKIVLNLLSNAFKFTLAGEIEVKLEALRGSARLTVRDTGVGIPSDQLEKVFERFHRVRDSRGRTHEGTGIGLALVQELVRLHGGHIHVESILNEGSRFVVTLPFGRSHLDADRIRTLVPRPAHPAHGAAAFSQEALRWTNTVSPPPGEVLAEADAPTPVPNPADALPARILWADDNADMRDYVSRLLSSQGYEVTAVADGEAALAAARLSPPDLVLSDVMMPRLDGFGLLRALRTDPHLGTAPVILLSARAGEEARVEGVGAGADDYLVKPFSARELLARIAAHLKMVRLRRAADARLRLSEERYRALAAASGDVFYRMSPDWQEMTELDGKGFLPDTAQPNRDWPERYLPPDDRARVFATITDAIRERRVFDLEHRVIRLDGTLGWAHSRAVPLLDERGEIREWFGAATDVTARRQAEANLKQARDTALAANRAKDDFLAALSHELRTPLNPVLLVASDAAHDPELPEAVRGHFRMIADNVSLQARLIDDLLDLNRLIRGKISLETEKLDLHRVIHDAATTVQEEIAAKSLTLAFDLRATSPFVTGDPVRLRQVFWNVLKNSVKFTPERGRITLSSLDQPDEDQIEVRIQDSGIGLTSGELARIFNPFVQGRHTEEYAGTGYGGLGLGLAISRMLIERQGGSIHAESTGPGHGATLVVRFPRRQELSLATIAPDRGSAPQIPMPRTTASGPARRALFVEDHPPTRTALSSLLRRHGYHVLVADSVTSALQLAETEEFDVLISDLGLPDGDGCSLMSEIRRRRPALPGVAISGYGMADDLERSRAAGFGEHLTKPVSFDLLARALGRLEERS